MADLNSRIEAAKAEVRRRCAKRMLCPIAYWRFSRILRDSHLRELFCQNIADLIISHYHLYLHTLYEYWPVLVPFCVWILSIPSLTHLMLLCLMHLQSTPAKDFVTKVRNQHDKNLQE